MCALLSGRIEYTFIDNDAGQVTTQVCAGCPSDCPFEFSATGGNTTYSSEYLAYNRIMSGGCGNVSHLMTLTYDAFNTIANRFIVTADGVELFNSGCITGSGTASITIPANTLNFDVKVWGACNNLTGDQWSFSGGCA